MNRFHPKIGRRIVLILAIFMAVIFYVITVYGNGSDGMVEVQDVDEIKQNIQDQSFENMKRKLSQSNGLGKDDDYEKDKRFSGKLDVNERSRQKYFQTGWVFNKTGRMKFVATDITSSLIHSFSPYIEKEAARRFIDPPRSNSFVANSPAVMWFHNELVLVSRIWLVREKYEPDNKWPANHFSDNYFYTQKYDRSLRPISNGSIMGIPTPKQWWVGDGPIEPRLCKVKGNLFVTFNTAMNIKHHQSIDFTLMWNYVENVPIIPEIKGGSPMINASDKNAVVRDKHWMALIQNDELYFVHNLEPLRVMKCSLAGFCEFIHKETNKEGFVFDHHISHLRGGTPFELYQYPYYISVAHTTMYKQENHHRYYSAHIVVLCVKPYRIVYVSDALKIHPDIYADAPMVRPRWIDDGFIFPVGLLLETEDWMTIGVHVNDFSSVLIRFKGIKKLMEKVIKADKTQHKEKPVDYNPDKDGRRYGPPIGYLNHHLHDTQENLTHVKFED